MFTHLSVRNLHFATLVVLMFTVNSCQSLLSPGSVSRLEREAKVLAITSGCANAGDCRSAPVGVKACGGPRYYLPYCPATTDSAALFRKLAELAEAEREYNRRNRITSDCSVPIPAPLVAANGTCQFAP